MFRAAAVMFASGVAARPSAAQTCGSAAHSNVVTALVSSVDGSSLVSASLDSTIKLWKFSDGSLIKSVTANGQLIALAASPDGLYYSAATNTSGIQAWSSNWMMGGVLNGHSFPPQTLLVTPDGKLLVSGSADLSVRLWRVSDGSSYRTLMGHAAGIRALAVTRDSELLLTAGDDSNIILWTLPDGRRLTTVNAGAPILSLAVTADGQALAAGLRDGSIQLYNVPGIILLKTLTGHTGAVRSLSFSANGQLLMSAGNDGTVRTWALPGLAQSAMQQVSTGPIEAALLTGSLVCEGGDDNSIRFLTLPGLSLGRCLSDPDLNATSNRRGRIL